MKTILMVLLIGSVTYNVYQFYNTAKGLPADCCYTEGYAHAIVLHPDIAKECANEYAASLVSPDVTTGAIISRTAFDEILCMKDCNAIAYSLARDKSGTNGPENSGAFIIFEGVNVKYDAEHPEVITVTKLDGSQMYRPGNWCPPTCMVW